VLHKENKLTGSWHFAITQQQHQYSVTNNINLNQQGKCNTKKINSAVAGALQLHNSNIKQR